MNKKSEIIKDVILVTLSSIITIVLAFILYFLLFMIFENMGNKDGSYNFVSLLRVGNGIIWMVFCLIMYRIRIPDWIKAGILTSSLTAFMIGIGVQFFEMPLIAGLIVLITVSAAIYMLRKMNKKWYHYYAIMISIIAALFYL